MESGRLDEADQMRVGLADELECEADEAVAEDEGADELAGLVAGAGLPEHPDEDRHQHEAFENGLVELGGMTRDRAAGREDDAPGERGRPAPELAVHEIGEAAEEQAGRDAAGDVIVEPEPVELAAPGEVHDAEAHPDHAAVEAHPAVPETDDLDRVLQIFERLVEDHIAEPAAEDDAERGVKGHVVRVPPGHGRAGLADQLEQIPPADDDADQISEAVPAQLEPAPFEQDGMQAQIVELDRVAGCCHRCQYGVEQGFPLPVRAFIVGGQ